MHGFSSPPRTVLQFEDGSKCSACDQTCRKLRPSQNDYIYRALCHHIYCKTCFLKNFEELRKVRCPVCDTRLGEDGADISQLCVYNYSAEDSNDQLKRRRRKEVFIFTVWEMNEDENYTRNEWTWKFNFLDLEYIMETPFRFSFFARVRRLLCQGAWGQVQEVLSV